MGIKTVEERIKELEEANKSQLDDALSSNQKVYDTQKQQVADNYNLQLGKVNENYQQLIDENAVQKLINEREVEENMANLGLKDSGLTRTQQTAVQLSHANNSAKISIEKQKALDELSLSLANAVNELDINKATSDQSIKDSWNTNNQKYAVDMYNNEVTNYYSAVEKANTSAQDASYIIKANGGLLNYGYRGSLKDNGVSVVYDRKNNTTKYVDEKSGKSTTVPIWKNPYTNDDMHKDLKDATGSYDETKAFSNGYQPNNINGVKLKWSEGDTIYIEEIGRSQKVFSANGKYWTWYGGGNRYIEVAKTGNGWQIR